MEVACTTQYQIQMKDMTNEFSTYVWSQGEYLVDSYSETHRQVIDNL